MTPSNHFWILSSQFKQVKECVREMKTWQQLRGRRVPGCLLCPFCRNEEQSLLPQDGGYLNEACTSSWRQGCTDLILRLVPVFQIPVPQDHLKTKRTDIQSQLNATFVCICTCRNAFYTEGAQILLLRRFWVFPEGTARSDTGCQPLVQALIWIHTSNRLLWGFPGLCDARSATGMHAAAAVADCGLWLTGKRRKESHRNGRSESTMGLWDLIWQQLRQSAAFPRCLLVTRQQLSRLAATYIWGCVTLEFLKQPALSAKTAYVTGDDGWG